MPSVIPGPVQRKASAVTTGSNARQHVTSRRSIGHINSSRSGPSSLPVVEEEGARDKKKKKNKDQPNYAMSVSSNLSAESIDTIDDEAPSPAPQTSQPHRSRHSRRHEPARHTVPVSIHIEPQSRYVEHPTSLYGQPLVQAQGPTIFDAGPMPTTSRPQSYPRPTHPSYPSYNFNYPETLETSIPQHMSNRAPKAPPQKPARSSARSGRQPKRPPVNSHEYTNPNDTIYVEDEDDELPSDDGGSLSRDEMSHRGYGHRGGYGHHGGYGYHTPYTGYGNYAHNGPYMGYGNQTMPYYGGYGAYAPYPYGPQYLHVPAPPPPPTEPPEPSSSEPPAPDPDKVRLAAELTALKLEQDKVIAQEEKRNELEIFRKEVEHELKRKQDELHEVQERARREIAEAVAEAKKQGMEEVIAKQKADAERSQLLKDHEERIEKQVRAQLQAEQLAKEAAKEAGEMRRREAHNITKEMLLESFDEILSAAKEKLLLDMGIDLKSPTMLQTPSGKIDIDRYRIRTHDKRWHRKEEEDSVLDTASQTNAWQRVMSTRSQNSDAGSRRTSSVQSVSLGRSKESPVAFGVESTQGFDPSHPPHAPEIPKYDSELETQSDHSLRDKHPSDSSDESTYGVSGKRRDSTRQRGANRFSQIELNHLAGAIADKLARLQRYPPVRVGGPLRKPANRRRLSPRKTMSDSEDETAPDHPFKPNSQAYVSPEPQEEGLQPTPYLTVDVGAEEMQNIAYTVSKNGIVVCTEVISNETKGEMEESESNIGTVGEQGTESTLGQSTNFDEFQTVVNSTALDDKGAGVEVKIVRSLDANQDANDEGAQPQIKPPALRIRQPASVQSNSCSSCSGHARRQMRNSHPQVSVPVQQPVRKSRRQTLTK